jgi:hypothetical protein
MDTRGRVDWTKFLSTNMVTFIIGVAIATIMAFKALTPENFSTIFTSWSVFVGGLAVKVGVVRTVQKGQVLKHNAPDK